MEAHRLADSDQPNALLKFAVQMHRAVDVLKVNLVCAPLNGDIALYMFRTGGALLQVQHRSSGEIVKIDFAALMVDVDTAIGAGNGDLAVTGNDDQIGVARHVDIHVGG